MEYQTLLVFAILLVTVSFTARALLKKAGSFSPQTKCGTDCGCGNEKS